jgi:hypothetical protein
MTPQLHDERAYSIVRNVVDYAEERLVRTGICAPENAARYLALDYIATCSSAIEHGTQYLESDERIGADLFLAKLPTGALKAQYHRNRKLCAAHLAAQPWLHFADYKPILRIAFLNAIRTIGDVRELRFSGVALLACGTFDDAPTDLRREFRRRGLSYDPTLIEAATLARRIGSGDAGLLALPG